MRRKEKKKASIIVQENPNECIKLVEDSFLMGVFHDNVTDVSYNGTTFFAQDNDIGRYQLDIDVPSEEVLVFVKKIANYMLQPFSNLSPSLDVSFGDYRLNAIHPSLARSNNQRVVTFSLRKITATLKIKANDPLLCPVEVHELLRCLMESYQSALISGSTGSGKTEFQKYLISLMNPKDRLIVIEESYETHIKEIYKNMDVTSWIVDNTKDELASLIRLALRNNPDWLIVAETRGNEAYDFFCGVQTGHHGLTTIHSESAKYSLERLANMCKKTIDFDDIMMLSNMARHIRIGIHLEKSYDFKKEKYVRRITEIVEYIPDPSKGYITNQLYEVVKDEKLVEHHYIKPISDALVKDFIKHNIDLRRLKKFYNGGNK